MNQIFPEIISHIFKFLSISDRKEAALVCKKWYNASLHPHLQKEVIMKFRAPQDKSLQLSQALGRKVTHLMIGDTMSNIINEDHLNTLLYQCSNLKGLDLSGCNSIFLSGRFLSNEKDRLQLREVLKNVQELKLARLRHMTDVSFSRLVSILENLSSISLASTNMIFESGHSSATNSPAVFHFSNFVDFAHKRVRKMKIIDLSHTSVNDEALKTLSQVPELHLEEMILCGCMELSDKGIKYLAVAQSHLKKLDLSGCKELGNSKSFFNTLVQNLKNLHTLKLRKCPRVGQCDVASLCQLLSLRVLDMGEALNLYTCDFIKGICNPNLMLTSIYLAYCPDICDTFVSSLCQASPSLKHLDLTACNRITDTSIHIIAQNLLSLRSLKVAYCHRLTDLGILGYLPENGITHCHSFDFDHDSCNCMRERESRIFRKPTGSLKIHQTAITKAQRQLESGEVLFKLSDLFCLQTLDLSSCSKITDIGISEAVQFKDMRNLSLNNLPKLTDKGIQHLTRANPSLEIVNLRGCGDISDLTVKSLATHSPCLSILDISQNDKLTDESLFVIASKCKRLRQLDVSFCGNVSQETVMQLESEYEKLKINFRPHIFA